MLGSNENISYLSDQNIIIFRTFIKKTQFRVPYDNHLIQLSILSSKHP